MIVEPFSLWWCCIPENIRGLLSALVAAWAINPLYITKANFDSLSALFGVNVYIKMETFFISRYGLTLGVFVDAEGDPVEVYYFDLLLYPALFLFAASPDASCTSPCKIKVFSA